MTGAQIDHWIEVATTMGTEMAATFLKHVPQPFTPEAVKAGLEPAAAASLVIFNNLDGIEPEQAEALSAVVVTQILRTVSDHLAAQREVKH